MPADIPDSIVFPWLNRSVSTQLPDEPDGNEHLALNRMSSWPDELRDLLERACFANFLDMVYAIDASPPTVPAIKTVSGVWDHMDIRVVTPHGAEHILVYVVPEWDEDEHMEWCFRGDKLLYVGQFLGYSPNGYDGFDESANPDHIDRTITEYGHLPDAW